MKKNSTSGFTLIELLVVIAIIGILASVVLASLNTARNKGADAAIKSNLANARAQAELFYDDSNNSYDGVCAAAATDTPAGIAGNVAAATTAGSADVDCVDDASGWAVSAQLKTDVADYWCVDSSGASKETAAATADTTC